MWIVEEIWTCLEMYPDSCVDLEKYRNVAVVVLSLNGVLIHAKTGSWKLTFWWFPKGIRFRLKQRYPTSRQSGRQWGSKGRAHHVSTLRRTRTCGLSTKSTSPMWKCATKWGFHNLLEKLQIKPTAHGLHWVKDSSIVRRTRLHVRTIRSAFGMRTSWRDERSYLCGESDRRS